MLVPFEEEQIDEIQLSDKKAFERKNTRDTLVKDPVNVYI